MIKPHSDLTTVLRLLKSSPAPDYSDTVARPLPGHAHGLNQLLAALPADEYARLLPHLELVPMRLADVLYQPGERMQHVYFPTSCIVSLHYVMENGASMEIAGVGNEGMIGVSLFMGGSTTSSSALIQTGGFGYRLSAKRLIDEFQRGEAVQRLLLRYNHALSTQIAQTGACIRYHSVEQQLCRWLLLTLDRMISNDLITTQELIANMLGVRRESVTEAAGHLKELGVIDYRRGLITVLDRAGLNSHVCECYGAVKSEFDRLLDDVRPTR